MRGISYKVKTVLLLFSTICAFNAHAGRFTVVNSGADSSVPAWMTVSIPVFLSNTVERVTPWVPERPDFENSEVKSFTASTDVAKLVADKGVDWVWSVTWERDKVSLALWWAALGNSPKRVASGEVQITRNGIYRDVQVAIQKMLKEAGLSLQTQKLEFEALTVKDPYAVLIFARGLVAFKSGDVSVATAEFERAIRIDPTLEIARLYLGRVYTDLGDYRRAARYLQRGTQDYYSLWKAQAVAYSASGSHRSAEQVANKILQIDSADLAALEARGNANLFFKKYPKAIKDYNSILTHSPNSETALFGLRSALAAIGDDVALVDVLIRLVKLKPNDVDMSMQLAAALRSQKRNDEAVEVYRNLEKGPLNSAVVTYLLSDLGETTSPPTPQSGEECLLIAQSLEVSEGPEKAIERLRTCWPGSEASHVSAYLGELLLRNGDTESAIRHFKRALVSEPRNIAARTNLGIALLRKQDSKGALWHAKVAIGRDAQFAPALHLAAVAKARMGNLSEALSYAQRAQKATAEKQPRVELLLKSLCKQLRGEHSKQQNSFDALLSKRFKGKAGWLAGGGCAI